MTLALARAIAADAPALAQLSARCFAHGAWDEPAFVAELERPFAEVWLALADGELVGYAVAWFVGDDGELLTLGTDPAARRRGVGRALVERVKRSARERGVRSVTLEVREPNLAARGLYEGCGFATIDRRRRYYADGTDACVMSWTP